MVACREHLWCRGPSQFAVLTGGAVLVAFLVVLGLRRSSVATLSLSIAAKPHGQARRLRRRDVSPPALSCTSARDAADALIWLVGATKNVASPRGGMSGGSAARPEDVEPVRSVQ